MEKQTVHTIEAKMSGTGTIHDIASDVADRDIVFAPGCIYAVVLAAYYGGKGYTTHKTEQAACCAAKKLSRDGYSYEIIDRTGNEYSVVSDYWYDRLVRA